MGIRATLRRGCRDLLHIRALVLLIATPLLLLPLIFVVQTTEAKCAYVVILMAVYWTSEMIPLAATSLLPAVLFPLLGIMTANDVCMNYIKDTSMLYVGGLMVAIAIEKLNLHKRIALRVLLLVGADPKWLILGMMLPTWFLSMWISNTATTAMMVPIASAVLLELQDKAGDAESVDPESQIALAEKPRTAEDGAVVPDDTAKLADGKEGYGERTDNKERESLRLGKAMMLSIAYAANVGGLATLTGTPPNLVLQSGAEEIYKKHGGESPITYTNWMIFALPLAILCFFVTWMWLLLFFLRKRFWQRVTDKQRYRVKLILRGEYNKLGSMSGAEIVVLVLFILLAVLWLTRKPVFMPGWGSLFKEKFVKDSTVAMLISVILFIIPTKIPRVFCCRRPNGEPPDEYTPILDWSTVTKKMPWGIILLFGGGFALADGCQKSGLSKWVGHELQGLGELPPWVNNLILTFIVAAATEVTSNLATSTLLLPILADLAVTLGLNPLYFMMSAVVAASFAFMLPVATPPNAIVFSHGSLKVTDMASAGAVMNVVCILLLCLAVNTWGDAYFDLHTQPAIFRSAPGGVANGTLLLNVSTLAPT